MIFIKQKTGVSMKNNFIINKKPLIYTILLAAIFICSFLLSTSFALNFAINFTEKIISRTLRDHTKWINILKGLVHIPLLSSIIVFSIQYTLIGNQIAQTIKELWSNFISEIKQKKYFFLFITVTLFFLFSFYNIIHADILFADDMSRSHDGDRNWISFGRYISEFLSIILHCTIKLTDIAPLTQFISILLMSCTVITLLIVISDNNKINFIYIIPLCYTFLSPYFQQCFCYRFDSPYMTLAVLLPVIPFIFKNDIKAYSFMSFLMLIFCCMSYQAGQSVFIMIVIFIAFQRLINGDKIQDIFYFVLSSIIVYAAALIIYELLFAANTNRTDDNFYYSTKLSLKSFIYNLKIYIIDITHNSGGLLTRSCILISLLISCVGVYLKTKINKILSLFLYFILLLLSLLLSLGPYILFENTLFSGRIYMGYNVLISLLLYSSISTIFEFTTTRNKKVLFSLPLVICIYSSISFLYTFGNCLKEQKEYNKFRYTLIVEDLIDFINEEQTIYIAFKGTVGYCNSYEIAAKRYPLCEIPVMPSEGSIWNTDFGFQYNFLFEDEDVSTKPDWPLLISNYYHNIYGQNNHFYIELKNHN